MKKIVVTIMDDVCAKNGRDPEGTALIEAAKSFGKVETLDSAFAAERAETAMIIKNLREQLEAIGEHAVTDEELKILRAIRQKSALEATEYEATIAERDAQLQAIKTESENRVAQIKAIYGF